MSENPPRSPLEPALRLRISARVHERGYYASMEGYNLDSRRHLLARSGDAVDAT